MSGARRDAGIYVALVALLAATVALDFVDLGTPMNRVLAMSIASVKAILVVVFFMRIRRMTWLALAAGIVWWGLLVGFVMLDVATRQAPAVLR